jgi:hypothetical protein
LGGEKQSFTVAYTSSSVACSDNQFIENKFVLIMECVVNMRILDAVDFKLNVIKYAKQHSNGAAERHFGPSPTEMITFRVPSNKTVIIKVAKSIMIKIFGHEKTHYTVVLACFAYGRKLPPLLGLTNNA